MRSRFLFLAILAVFAAPLTGCGNEAVGTPCEVAQCNVQEPPDNANTVCEPATACETLLCIGQGQGFGTGAVDEYCSVDCDPEDNNACPEGFECAVVAEVGQNAGRTICLKPLNE